MRQNEGMRTEDFTKCRGCGKGVAHTGLPIFWRVKIDRMGIDTVAVQQTHAMEMFFGGNSQQALAVARAFQDPIIAKPIDGIDQVTVLICEECALKPFPLAMLAEEQKKEPAET